MLPVLHRLSAEVARTVRAGELSGAAEHDGHKTMACWLLKDPLPRTARKLAAGPCRGP